MGVLPACADPLISLLDAGALDVANRNSYQKDWRGQWVRRIEATRDWEKYCRTCNVWRPPR